MRGRPDEEVLRELMDEMNSMDQEKIGKKRRGPSITIAIGVPKGEGEKEGMEDMKEDSMEHEMAESAGMPVPELPGASAEPMEEENDLLFDAEEKALIEEAKGLGIEDPEEIDMRLLKKLIERKKAQG